VPVARSGFFRRRFFGLCSALIFALGLFARPADTNEMHFRVLDADTGKPVAGVKVRSWVNTPLVTDDNGWCTFAMPQPKSGKFAYRISIAKEGYVPKYVVWSTAQNDTLTNIPPEYTMNMDRGAAIGGTVKNNSGEPVAGARVIFSGPLFSGASDRERYFIGPNYHVERTDENGRWHCSDMPKNFRNFAFRVMHPDYSPTIFGCTEGDTNATDATFFPMQDYLSNNVVMVIGHGIVLSALVEDAAGKPVAGATITRNREWRNTAAVLETGDDGRIKIQNLQPGEILLTIQADHLAAQTVLVTLSNSMPELKIEMKRGRTLRGRLVDESGQPVVGAEVEMDRLDLGPMEYDWHAVTDNDGRFLWDGAPEDVHPYYFSAPGYHSLSVPALIADGEDKSIVLRKLVEGDKTRIYGSVLDATNNLPIDKFAVVISEYLTNGTTNVQNLTGQKGYFAAAVNTASAAYDINVRIDGYQTGWSARKYPGDGDVLLNFKMEKGVEVPPKSAALQIGDLAPLFETKTVDGQPLKLAGFRGRYVLLDFWATWCHPCVGEMPNLKATYDAFGKSPQFAMISLSLDASPAQPRGFARVNNIQWIQGFLGDWSQATIPNLYGVEGIPAIFLIGPDGRIVARDLRGDAIRAAVGQALGNQ
jgi:peroxiredoxin/5-hydroxyisourate hydrolase-like protein (transthyretin family)